jgi:polyhydroxyalkanoate synthesis regulator phasin
MALPKFEDYKAPWEVDTTGNPVAVEDQELDPAKLKKHLWNILSDKEKAQVARDTNATKVTELTTRVTELEAAKTPAGDKPAEGSAKENEQIAQLMKLVQDMGEKVKASDLNATKLTVISAKGLDPVADLGFFEKLDTAEEIEKMADTLVERGLAKKKTDSDDPDGEQLNPLGGKPPAPLNNGLPNGGQGEKVDVDAFISQYSSTNPLF